jgi:hypothetical protein
LCTIECLGPSSSIESFGILFFNSIPKIVIWKPFFTYFLSSKRVYKRSVKSLSNLGYNNNNNQALVPNFLGQLWIFNKIVMVGHMYFFAPFYFFFFQKNSSITYLKKKIRVMNSNLF